MLQLSSEPVSGGGGGSTSSASLLEISAFIRGEREESRKERLEFEARLEKQMQASHEENARLREEATEARAKELTNVEQAREQARLEALQARLQIMHAAKLLTDDEMFAVEDIIADSDESQDAQQASALVSLSGKMVADAAFARQLRRKFAS